MLKTWVRRRDPVSQTAVVTQGTTSLEQFTRLTLEEDLDKRGWKDGETHAVVGVRGEDGDVRVSKSRLAAFGRPFQSVRPIREMAEECDHKALMKCMDELEDDLEDMFGLRHGLTHALPGGRFDAEKPLRLVWRVMRAGMEGRPLYVVAALLVEASVMEAAGRADGARRAAEEALEVCYGVLEGMQDGDGGGGDARQARVCRAHALARLRRTDEAEAAYREAAEKSPATSCPLSAWATSWCRTAARRRPSSGMQGPWPSIRTTWRRARAWGMRWPWSAAPTGQSPCSATRTRCAAASRTCRSARGTAPRWR